ncbi:MAG: hypothetical protein JWO03_3688 [Bacteroidetes bacterium]|nr:hypothetical protein [Bacteroidota bacterium]
MIKDIALYALIGAYFLAGVNHFWHPKFYYKITPKWLPSPYWINIIAGVIEIVFAILMIFPQTRLIGSWLIIAMLIAFIPSHIYFFEAYPEKKLFGWIRLVVIHPLLIGWAYWVG